MAENKVQFNLKNVHYAILTETESDGDITCSYGDTKAVRGAVSIDLSQEGEMSPFYADGIKYYITRSNQGYSGSLEMAMITDEMLVDIFGMEHKSTDDVIIENVDDKPKDFALMFQIDGDSRETFYCLYKCSASRPSIASRTNEESKEPQTMTLDISISPMLDTGRIMAKSNSDEYDIEAWVEIPYGYGNQGGA